MLRGTNSRASLRPTDRVSRVSPHPLRKERPTSRRRLLGRRINAHLQHYQDRASICRDGNDLAQPITQWAAGGHPAPGRPIRLRTSGTRYDSTFEPTS